MEKKIKKSFFEQFRFFVSLPALLWQIFFLLIPFLIILLSTFFSKGLLNFDINYFVSVLDYPHIKILVRTLAIAFLNTTLCLLLAYPVAYFIAFNGSKYKFFWLTLLMLPLWIEFLVQVYAWFFVLDEHGLINSTLLSLGLISEPLHLMNNLFGVILVMIYIYLPFMIMPLYNVLEKIDTQLIEASQDLGASKWKTFTTVTLPLSMSGIYLGFFLVFSMSFGEVAIPMLMGGNKTLFNGILISQYYLSTKDTPMGAAFTLVNGIVLALILFIFYRLFKRKVV